MARFLEVLERDPQNFAAIYSLATITEHQLGAEALGKIHALLEREDLAAEPRKRLPQAGARDWQAWGWRGSVLPAGTVLVHCEQGLDLVITSDTSIPHLAGGLGVPRWLAVAANPDFRWMESGDTAPWYVRMRLFRQPAPGAWAQVFAAMAAALRSA